MGERRGVQGVGRCGMGGPDIRHGARPPLRPWQPHQQRYPQERAAQQGIVDMSSTILKYIRVSIEIHLVRARPEAAQGDIRAATPRVSLPSGVRARGASPLDNLSGQARAALASCVLLTSPAVSTVAKSQEVLARFAPRRHRRAMLAGYAQRMWP